MQETLTFCLLATFSRSLGLRTSLSGRQPWPSLGDARGINDNEPHETIPRMLPNDRSMMSSYRRCLPFPLRLLYRSASLADPGSWPAYLCAATALVLASAE